MSNAKDSIILLVEDEPGHIELIKRMFEKNRRQWKIVTCQTTREAKERLKEISPMAMLLDNRLPDDTGFNFLNQLARDRNLLPLPVIMLTSHGNEDLAVKAMRLGAEDYIVKSEEGFQSILQRVEQAINHWNAKCEKLRLQQQLKRSEQKYRSLIYNMHAGIMLISTTGQIIEVNPAFLDIFDYKQSTLKDKSIEEIFQSTQMTETGVNLFKNEEVIRNLPIVIKTFSGEKKIIEISSKPIRDEKGNILFIEIIIHDVTAQKQMEAELIRSKRKAEEANRMKTAFFHNISHELRTPLNAILGFTQLLLQKKLASDVREMLNYILLSGNNLGAIINDLLDITRIEAGKTNISLSPIMTQDLVRYLSNEFQKELLDKGLKFETQISANVPKVFISDNLRLQQILTNLLSNAIKFTSKGTVSLSVDSTEEKLLFIVSDTGIGIAWEDQKRIFEDFVQLENSGSKKQGGVGLGLAISKRIAELLQGEIWVRSKIGRGTSFFVSIPLLNSSTIDQNSSEKIEYDVTAKKQQILNTKTMLLADDEPFSRRIIEEAVKNWGWNVITVTNGKEVLDTLYTVFVDLVVLDMQMPVLDGYETSRKIKNDPFHKNIPVIAMTAYAMESDKERCFEAGCDDFISKPVDLVQFKSLIERWYQDENETNH